MDLENLTLKDLYKKVFALKVDIFALNVQKTAGALKNTSSIKKVKKLLANVLRVINKKRKFAA